MKRSTRLALFLALTFSAVATAAWALPKQPTEPAPFVPVHMVPAVPAAAPKPQLCAVQPCVVTMLFGSASGPEEMTKIHVEKLAFYMQKAQDAGAKAILITFLSPGGDFEAGKAIFKLIKESPIPVDCVAAIAASAAYWDFQACRTRYVLPGSYLMTHEVYLDPVALAKSEDPLTVSVLEARAADLRRSIAEMAADIAPRMGMTIPAYIAKVHDGDWEMEGPEALKLHAADRLVQSVAEARALTAASLTQPSPPDAGADR